MEAPDQNNLAKQQQEEELKKLLLLKKMLLRKGMSPEARERLARVKLANPELASKAEAVALQLIQQGRYVTDEVLRKILERLAERKPRIRIMRW